MRKRGTKIAKLQPPVEPPKTPLDELLEILIEVEAKEENAKGTSEQSYWQGKKDGIRIALIVLKLMDEEDQHNYRQIQMSSMVSDYTDKERVKIFEGPIGRPVTKE